MFYIIIIIILNTYVSLLKNIKFLLQSTKVHFITHSRRSEYPITLKDASRWTWNQFFTRNGANTLSIDTYTLHAIEIYKHSSHVRHLIINILAVFAQAPFVCLYWLSCSVLQRTVCSTDADDTNLDDGWKCALILINWDNQRRCAHCL